MSDRPFQSLRIAVLTVSDSRHAGDDASGDLLVQRLTDAGHELAGRGWVKDDIYAVRATVSQWIADPSVHVFLTTGGTGVTGRDGTPEAVAPLLDKQIDGFGEVFRAISYEIIGTSTLQSRALAGVANGTYGFVLPGSPSACRDAWDHLLSKQLDIRTRPCNLAELIPRLLEK